MKHLVAVGVALGTLAGPGPGGTRRAAAEPGLVAPLPAADVAPVELDALLDAAWKETPALAALAAGTVHRARRAVALGPTVGAALGLGGDAPEAAVAVGLGLELFAVPVAPGLATLRALARERAKALLAEQLAALARGEPPAPDALARLAAQVWQDAVRELLGQRRRRGKLLERPRLSLAFEVGRLLEAGAWSTRLRAGVGVWKLTVGGSAATVFTDPVRVHVGPELVVHLLPSRSPRSPVIDVFLRADLGVRDGDANLYGVGARLLLDLI